MSLLTRGLGSISTLVRGLGDFLSSSPTGPPTPPPATTPDVPYAGIATASLVPLSSSTVSLVAMAPATISLVPFSTAAISLVEV